MPLLPGRDRPQHPGAALPVGHRAHAARPGVEARPGRPPGRAVPPRDIVDGIRYLVKEGVQWRAMPADFSPHQAIYDIRAGWQASGATEAMHGELRDQCRIAAGRKPQPTAAVIDSQSVKVAEEVARAGRGYDAGNYAGWLVMPGDGGGRWPAWVGAASGRDNYRFSRNVRRLSSGWYRPGLVVAAGAVRASACSLIARSACM